MSVTILSLIGSRIRAFDLPISVTLDDLERCSSRRVFSRNYTGECVTMVEDIPIMSVKYCLPVPVFHFWPKRTHPAARSLR